MKDRMHTLSKQYMIIWPEFITVGLCKDVLTIAGEFLDCTGNTKWSIT